MSDAAPRSDAPARDTTTSAVADTVVKKGETAAPKLGESARADSARATRPATVARRQRKASRFDEPRWVMLRSLAVPGWGQAHNRAWIKASVVAASEIALAVRLFDDRNALDRLLDEVEKARESGDQEAEIGRVDAYNARLSRYQSRQWLLGAVITYALLDAYIDAHFRQFKLEFEGDPALTRESATGRTMRIGLRWNF